MTLRFPPVPPTAWTDTESSIILQQATGELPTLVSPRLSLRPLASHDTDPLYEIFSDAQTMRFWNRPPLRSPKEMAAHQEANQRERDAGRLLQWSVTLTSSSRVVGLCQLAQSQPTDHRADIGFVLARAHWGCGYGLEALAALLDHALDVRRLHRLEADVDARNLYYLKTLETLGFKAEGYLRQRWRVDGQPRDTVLLGLLGRDHRARAGIATTPR